MYRRQLENPQGKHMRCTIVRKVRNGGAKEFYDRIKDMQHDVKACFMIAGSNSGEDFITKRLPGNNKRVCVAIKPIRLQELILLLNVELEGSNSIDSTIPIISDWQMPSSSQQQKVSPK